MIHAYATCLFSRSVSKTPGTFVYPLEEHRCITSAYLAAEADLEYN